MTKIHRLSLSAGLFFGATAATLSDWSVGDWIGGFLTGLFVWSVFAITEGSGE